jgi:hypothetical protein
MQHEKICKVHGELAQEYIIVEPNKSSKRGYTLRCRHCKNDKDARYKQTHRKELVQRNTVYKANNRDIVNTWERENRKRNPEKYKKYEENYIKKHGRIRIRKMEVARLHGLTIEQYDSLFDEQNHKCKICGLEETRKGSSGDVAPLCVDHCHKCRDKGHLGLLNVRALLCAKCNLMIGYAEDKIETLKSAIAYLEHHSQFANHE